jgi:hypothetical protein
MTNTQHRDIYEAKAIYLLHTSPRDIYEIHTFEIYMTPTNYISIFLKQYHCHSSQSLFGTCCHFSLFLFQSLTFFSHPHSLLSSFTHKHTHTQSRLIHKHFLFHSHISSLCYILSFLFTMALTPAFSLYLSLSLPLFHSVSSLFLFKIVPYKQLCILNILLVVLWG